jgi:anti-anti-sigma regulatory factor
MKRVALSAFGRTLTDREFGKSVAARILTENSAPIALDFSGVITLGSSCGDEIVNAVADRQNREIEIFGANPAIVVCLEKVAEDLGVKLRFL